MHKKNIKKWAKTARNVFLEPSKFFEKMPVKGGLAEPLKFAIACIFIYSLLVGFRVVLTLGMELAVTVATILLLVIISVVGGIIGIFVFAGIEHLVLGMLGGKGKFEGTFRVVSYASVVYLVSWIPIVNIVASVYMIYLYVVGFSKVHKISGARSFLAVIIPLLIMIGILVGITMLAFSSLLNMELAALGRLEQITTMAVAG